MSAPVFIGDEITATGYRLAGVRVLVTPTGDSTEALRQALADRAALIILGRDNARALEGPWLESLIRRGRPPITVVTPMSATRSAGDWPNRVRRTLGLVE